MRQVSAVPCCLCSLSSRRSWSTLSCWARPLGQDLLWNCDPWLLAKASHTLTVNTTLKQYNLPCRISYFKFELFGYLNFKIQGGRILWRALVGCLSQGTRACLTWDANTELVNSVSVLLAMGLSIELWLVLCDFLCLTKYYFHCRPMSPTQGYLQELWELSRPKNILGCSGDAEPPHLTHVRESRKSVFFGSSPRR